MNEEKSATNCCGKSTDMSTPELITISMSPVNDDKNENKENTSNYSSDSVTNKPEHKIISISTELSFQDKLGHFKARWGIGRMKYTIEPGLYSINSPDRNSPIFVTANYKLSFDMLRKELSGIDAYILVLNTKGINVWCAAGKGRFGTRELIYRVKLSSLEDITNHRKLILPQLGAPGIAAHVVEKFTGFKVAYGPVRASDIKAYLKNNLKTTPEMRKVNFTFRDRLVLTPSEIVPSLKYLPVIFGLLLILNYLKGTPLNSVYELIPFIAAVFIGTVLTQILLPYIPFRAFSAKGWVLGLLFAICFNYLTNASMLINISNVLILPIISSFLALNFTGASTYTSLSGVKKEMKYAIPAMIISISGGLIIRIIDSIKDLI